MNCEPACAWVVHGVPGYGRIHHSLTCPNHPVIGDPPEEIPIPEEAKLPRNLAIQARRSAVEHWWSHGESPPQIAERLHCSVYAVRDDIVWLRFTGRIGKRPKQPVTLETLRAE